MIDLHIHTNYSGGQSNLKEVLQIAQRRKVSIIAITDNNTCEAYKELNNILIAKYYKGKIIPGCEFSTIVNNVPIELIGYNIDTDLAQEEISKLYLSKLDYNIYETNLAKGIQLTDNEILTLLVKKINDKENQPSTYAYNLLGKNATKEELLLVAKYPTQSVKIFNNSSTASNTASSLYKAETLYLGNGDAFRHAYWNALNVKSVGADIAKAFANAHESETPEGNDKTMDLRNNTVGRNIGRIYSNSSNATIKNKVIEAVNQGRLYRLYNNNIKGKLITTDS